MTSGGLEEGLEWWERVVTVAASAVGGPNQEDREEMEERDEEEEGVRSLSTMPIAVFSLPQRSNTTQNMLAQYVAKKVSKLTKI